MSVVVNDSGTVRYLTGAKAALVSVIDVPAKPSRPKEILETDGFGEIAAWGDDNIFPQHVIEDCEPSTIIPQTLEKQSRMLQSSGLMYGNLIGYTRDGQEIFEPVIDDEVEDWMMQTNIKRYLREASLSFYWFYNLFPEIILSADRKKITHIFSKKSEYCRWSKELTKFGFSKYCYMNAQWEDLPTINNDETIRVDVVDPYFGTAEQLLGGKAFKYIYPLSYPTPGKTFYQLAPWNAVRTSGWLDVSKSIPTFKKALFQNQITIKYLIEVSTWWWNWAYPGFDKKTAEQKKEIMDKEAQNFENFMTGSDKAGMNMMTTFQSDPMLQKKYEGWKITAIDNKLKDGIYIEDSNEASSHLLYALGIDPTIIGTMPGTKMGAGSGSDKRVAYNIYISTIEPHRDVILEPLQFAFRYNGWPYKLKFRNTKIISLDQGGETQQQAS